MHWSALCLLVSLRDLGLVMDEMQYQEIAVNLAEGRGFSLNGQTTSWRPPLYPFVLAGLYLLTGTTDPTVARAFQTVLSLVNCLVVFALGRQLFGGTVAVGAALVFAFYPSLLFYNNHVLTEVLFTFLLTLTAWSFAGYLRSGRPRWLAASGAALALTVLTREVLWPMLGSHGAADRTTSTAPAGDDPPSTWPCSCCPSPRWWHRGSRATPQSRAPSRSSRPTEASSSSRATTSTHRSIGRGGRMRSIPS